MTTTKKYNSYLTHRFKDLALILFGVSFCLFPLLSLTTNINHRVAYFFISFMYLVCSITVPLFFFRYKYYPNATDFYYSLPFKRKDLFRSSLWSGYLVTIIPISISVLIGIISESLIDNSLFVSLILEYLNIVFFFSVIYATVILIIQLCNNMLDTIVSTIALVNFPFILGYLFFAYIESTTGTNTFDPEVMVLVSPVSNLFFALDIELSFLVYLLYTVVLIISLVLASSIFYKRAQSANQFEATKILKKIIKYLAILTAFFFVSFIGSSNFDSKFGEILFSLIASTTTFLAVCFMDHRALKVTTKEVVVFVLLMIVLVSFVVILPKIV